MKLVRLSFGFLVFCLGFLLVFGVAQAQSKPDIPEFTLKLVDRSFELYPPPAPLDPDTGELIGPNIHIDSWVIEVTIKNQNNAVAYMVRSKPDFEQEWNEKIKRSSIPSNRESDRKYSVTLVNSDYSDGTRVEVQVRTMSGNMKSISPHSEREDELYVINNWQDLGGGLYFDGEIGDWSKSQIITIDRTGDGLSDQTLYKSGFNWVEFGLLVTMAAMIVAAVLLIFKKSNKRKMLKPAEL